MTTLLDYNPHGVPDGDTFTFLIDDNLVVVERWVNDSSSGREVYNKTGASTVLDLDSAFGIGTEDRVEAIMDHVDMLWADAFAEHLQPIYDRERAKLVEEVNEVTQ